MTQAAPTAPIAAPTAKPRGRPMRDMVHDAMTVETAVATINSDKGKVASAGFAARLRPSIPPIVTTATVPVTEAACASTRIAILRLRSSERMAVPCDYDGANWTLRDQPACCRPHKRHDNRPPRPCAILRVKTYLMCPGSDTSGTGIGVGGLSHLYPEGSVANQSHTRRSLLDGPE